MAIKLQIDIIGPRPNEVDVDELINVLEDLSKAISACLPDNDSEHDSQLGARVSLVGIVEGSDGLVMEVQPRAARAIGRISQALRAQAYDDLPVTAHAALYRINQFVARRKWGDAHTSKCLSRRRWSRSK